MNFKVVIQFPQIWRERFVELEIDLILRLGILLSFQFQMYLSFSKFSLYIWISNRGWGGGGVIFVTYFMIVIRNNVTIKLCMPVRVKIAKGVEVKEVRLYNFTVEMW